MNSTASNTPTGASNGSLGSGPSDAEISAAQAREASAALLEAADELDAGNHVDLTNV
jgi:hypothetical protein